jgi:hypothetical protein
MIMKYLLTMVLALIVSIPVSAQRHQGKRTHDKAKVVSTTKCDKDCKCVCHKKDASHERGSKRLSSFISEALKNKKGMGAWESIRRLWTRELGNYKTL